jgi:hypothetical protein
MDTLAVVAAWVAVILLLVLVGFQVALAAGVPWGKAAYGGASATLTPAQRVSSGVAAVIWALVAWFFLALAIPTLAGPVPDSWQIVVLWVLVALFAIATAMNGISRSRIERAIWTPVSAVLLVCALVNVFRAIALSSLAG